MYYYRLSKYKGSNAQKVEEWTSFCEIGKTFHGKELTKEEYLCVETRYISCIIVIMKLCGAKKMRITYFEPGQNKTHWKVGQLLCGKGLRLFIQDCLREKCWGILEHPFYRVEFGWDFYVHIGCNQTLPSIKDIADQFELTVEGWERFPYGYLLQVEGMFLHMYKKIRSYLKF